MAQPQPSPLTQFIYFPLLPNELQILIWNHSMTLPITRILRLQAHQTSHAEDDNQRIHAFTTTAIPHPYLSISQTSRSSILLHYPETIPSQSSQRKIRFHPDRDIIFIWQANTNHSKGIQPQISPRPHSLAEKEFFMNCFGKVKHIAAFEEGLQNTYSSEENPDAKMEMMSCFPSLESINLLVYQNIIFEGLVFPRKLLLAFVRSENIPLATEEQLERLVSVREGKEEDDRATAAFVYEFDFSFWEDRIRIRQVTDPAFLRRLKQFIYLDIGDPVDENEEEIPVMLAQDLRCVMS